ncbi:glycosyltransferase family protein [Neiella marina]|uniref:Glycosyltransferase family protein n=1 Tax=Neiella holothuriorum TaxID=2870530 RepID=A0ABS7EF32_9GAMM|nr:glycosyltransferase [Neiella holothuriorum]MBW8190829.1 glycosyltransferase family protein [Neiella holothuriorum]
MTKRYQIVAASAAATLEETLLYQSLLKLNHDNYDVGLDVTTSNQQGLAALYNAKLDEYQDIDYIIFCHDDITIEDALLYEKVAQAIGEHSNFSVCGVAGTRECVIGEKNLWHWMYKGFGTNAPQPFSGAVAHYIGRDNSQCHVTNFGPTPQRCALLDGVFLAVNVKDLQSKKVRFDDNYPSKFHFYDLDFSLECNQAGLMLTTWPIWLIHASGGLSSTKNEQWAAGNQYFIDKWTRLLGAGS